MAHPFLPSFLSQLATCSTQGLLGLPLQCDLPKPPALAQHWLYGPCPRFPIVFKQTWGAEERLTTDRNLKPNPFAQISQAPGVTSLHLSADALGQGPACGPRCQCSLLESPDPEVQIKEAVLPAVSI